jgi:hypothetical protein
LCSPFLILYNLANYMDWIMIPLMPFIWYVHMDWIMIPLLAVVACQALHESLD